MLRDVKHTSGPPHSLKQPLPQERRESFLTYISCDVHKNAAFETFRGGNRWLARDARGMRAFCAGQEGRIWDGAELGTGAPSPQQSACTARAGGARRGTCSCAPVPAAGVTERSGTPSAVSLSNLTETRNGTTNQRRGCQLTHSDLPAKPRLTTVCTLTLVSYSRYRLFKL